MKMEINSFFMNAVVLVSLAMFVAFPESVSAQTECIDGMAGEFSCENVSLLSQLQFDQLGGSDSLAPINKETGLEVDPVCIMGQVTTAHEDHEVTLHLVDCRSRVGEPILAEPAVVEARWVTCPELRQLRMPPANAEIIAHLEAIRRRRTC